MGADIYLSSKFDKNFDEVQKEIDEVKRLFESTSKQTLLDVADGEDEDKLMEALRPLFDKQYSIGYFRDSYNSSSLLGQLGLSWWQDISPRLEDCYLPVEDCKWLLDEINNNRLGENPREEPVMSKILSLFGSNASESAVELDAERLEYFVKKKIAFSNLLKDAIELNEPLYCSI